MQLSKPPSPTSIVYVKIQCWKRGKQQGKSRAFTVYNASPRKLKDFLMASVEKKEKSNG